MKKNDPGAVLLVILAGVFWGMINIFVKTLSAAGISSLQIAAVRMIVASIVMVVFLLIKDKKKLKFRLKDIWMFIGTGIVSVTLFNFCYFYTMIHGEASVAVVLLYTSPVFIIVLSAILFKERITMTKVIATVLTIIGCAFVAGLFGGGISMSIPVFMTGIASGLFYALYTIFGRYALAKYDALTVTAYTFVFGCISSLPTCHPVSLVRILSDSPKLIIWGIGIGIFCTVLPYAFYTLGLNRMESGKAAVLVAIEPVVGAVIGMTVFHESRNIGKILGILLVLSAIVLSNLHISNKKH